MLQRTYIVNIVMILHNLTEDTCSEYRDCNLSESKELSLVLHTSLLEKKPPLSLLSIESWSRSEEGRGYQQILPKLSSTAFSMKSTQYIC